MPRIITGKNLMKIFTFILLSYFAINSLMAQDLFEERIRRIPSRKKSIFLNRGIFHNGGSKRVSKLNAIRHNYTKNLGYERVVFDFGTKKVPRIYGHISSTEKKIYIDLFNTKIPKNIGSFGNSKYIESMNLFPISDDTLSIEINFKQSIAVDLFYLNSPGRLVLDIKG